MSVEQWVRDGIKIAEIAPAQLSVTESRYPFTYAYDFMRSHAAAFGMREGRVSGETWSRGDMAGKLRQMIQTELGHGAARWESLTNPEREQVAEKQRELACLLADAYIREHNLRWEGNQKRML